MLRYFTAGESHGKALVAILEGMPAGVKIDSIRIEGDLVRRRMGYGRSGRMVIERDRLQILSGIRKGLTTGSPIALEIENKDFSLDELPAITRPRPGHADLAGMFKYNERDGRNILERASARETCARTALGAICKLFLDEFGIGIISHVIMLGGIKAEVVRLSFNEIRLRVLKSKLNCSDPKAERRMLKKIDEAKAKGDSLGGAFEVVTVNVPVGLGSCMHYDRRLDTHLAGAVMSIPGIKAVEIGQGIESAAKSGSEVHDEIFYDTKKGFYRKTNRAGGIEGGMSNGSPIVVRGYMKPIPTLRLPLATVDVLTKRPESAAVERADVCAVPAAGVVAEAVVAFELARAHLEKFGGDSLAEVKRNYEGYLAQVK